MLGCPLTVLSPLNELVQQHGILNSPFLYYVLFWELARKEALLFPTDILLFVDSRVKAKLKDSQWRISFVSLRPLVIERMSIDSAMIPAGVFQAACLAEINNPHEPRNLRNLQPLFSTSYIFRVCLALTRPMSTSPVLIRYANALLAMPIKFRSHIGRIVASRLIVTTQAWATPR
jgi:hypothetical protein